MEMTKSEKTRVHILDSAARVLAEHGYVDARLDSIAAAAGMKAGSLYYHFASREELVEEVLSIAIGRMSDAVKSRLRALPEDASYRDRISAAIETQLLMALQHDPYTAASFRLTMSLPSPLKEQQIAMQRKYGNLWRDLFVKAQAAGEIDPAFDLSALRMLLLGSINWSIEWYRAGTLTPAEIAAQLTSMFFDGVSPRARAGRPGRRVRDARRSAAGVRSR